MKQLITFFFIALITINSNSQNVGIGTSTPAYPLDVTGNTAITGNFVNKNSVNQTSSGVIGSCTNTPGIGYGVTGSGGYVGVYGSAVLPGGNSRQGIWGSGANGTLTNYGVLGNGGNGSGSASNYGVSGIANGGTTAYGIYGTATNATTNWAGYFESGNVYIQNNLGIGTTNGQGYPLNVFGNGTATTGSFTNNSNGGTGVSGNSSAWIGVEGDGGITGVRGQGQTGLDGEGTGISTGVSYGVFGDASGGTTAYGIYGKATGATTNWAGYFNGETFCTDGVWQSSDRKLKDNIQPLNGAIAIINRLNPSVYTFKTTEFKQMNLPKGLHYGLIADEIQKVVPGAVKKTMQPAEYENHDVKKGKKLSEEVEFNAVNYTEMIPILIAGIKEQQKTIEQLQMQITSQQKQIEEINNLLKSKSN